MLIIQVLPQNCLLKHWPVPILWDGKHSKEPSRTHPAPHLLYLKPYDPMMKNTVSIPPKCTFSSVSSYHPGSADGVDPLGPWSKSVLKVDVSERDSGAVTSNPEYIEDVEMCKSQMSSLEWCCAPFLVMKLHHIHELVSMCVYTVYRTIANNIYIYLSMIYACIYESTHIGGIKECKHIWYFSMFFSLY